MFWKKKKVHVGANGSLPKTSFELYSPEASRVEVVGDFTEWQQNPVALTKEKDGFWRADIELSPGSYEYRFLVDGAWAEDPHAPMRVKNPYGTTNSLIAITDQSLQAG